MKLVAVCGAETTPVLCCHSSVFSFPSSPLQKTCLFSLIGAARASVCVKHAVLAAPCDGFAVGGSGMDSLWCPVLVAALAGSLCSSPALADRKFGKQSFHLDLFYLRCKSAGSRRAHANMCSLTKSYVIASGPVHDAFEIVLC